MHGQPARMAKGQLLRAFSSCATNSRRSRISFSPSLVKRTIAQRDWIGSMILDDWLHASANLHVLG